MLLKVLYGILIFLGAFIVLTLIRAIFFTPKKLESKGLEPETVDVESFKKHLSQAIAIKTISDRDKDKVDWEEFKKFRSFLEETYPLVHKALTREDVSDASLLYRWKGRDSSLEPIALLSHMDVVPVSQGTEQDWVHPAFEGYNDGEFIWGRGAIDMKNHLIAIMESVETLISEGYSPERDVYICFGHDEEVMSATESGARTIVRTLQERGVTLDSVLDDGGAILPVNIKGVMNKYLAGIGVAEKGHADFEITVSAKGGHSSQPPKHSALGKLSKVVLKLENHQFKAKLSPMMCSLFNKIGRNVSYPARIVTCNIWLLKPLIVAICKQIPPAACMIRTTTAVTQAKGSPAPNVLPQKASVTANFRIMPDSSVKEVEEHIKKVVGKGVEVSCIKGEEPSNISPTDSRAFKAIEEICRGMNSDNIVAPYLVMGGTDARNYEPICKNVYRYSPFLVDTALLLTTHGTNERIPVSSLEDGVAFFKRYIKALSSD